MAQFIKYTEEEKEQARKTDIGELLRRQGESLKRSGSENEWRDGSQKVIKRILLFCRVQENHYCSKNIGERQEWFHKLIYSIVFRRF